MMNWIEAFYHHCIEYNEISHATPIGASKHTHNPQWVSYDTVQYEIALKEELFNKGNGATVHTHVNNTITWHLQTWYAAGK